MSINARELLAVPLGLYQFRSALQGRTVAVFCDNTAAVAYLCKEGDTRSPLLHTLAQEILRWTESPLHSFGSAVPPGLQLRPCGRPVSPSTAPTFIVVTEPDRLSLFEKTLAGPHSFVCHLRQSSLFDILLTIPGSDISSHGRVSPVLGRSSGLCVPSGGYHSACSRNAPGLHGDGAHSNGSTLGSRTCSSFRWLLQWSYRPVMTSCACLGLVIFPRISVGSGFMPSASPAISQSLWLLLRSRGAVFAGAPSILARSISGRWSIYREWYHTNGHSVYRPTLARVAAFLYWLRYTRGLMFPPCMVTVQCYLRCSVFTFHPCLRIR